MTLWNRPRADAECISNIPTSKHTEVKRENLTVRRWRKTKLCVCVSNPVLNDDRLPVLKFESNSSNSPRTWAPFVLFMQRCYYFSTTFMTFAGARGRTWFKHYYYYYDYWDRSSKSLLLLYTQSPSIYRDSWQSVLFAEQSFGGHGHCPTHGHKRLRFNTAKCPSGVLKKSKYLT